MIDLPPGWVRIALSGLVSPAGLFSDGDWVESKDQDANGSIRLLQLADVGDGVFLNKSSRFVNEEQFKRLRCTEVLEGDILIARMPDPLGRACLAPRLPQRCITVVDVAILRPRNALVHTDWAMYALNAPQVRTQIDLESSGTTRRRIARGKLALFELPVPPVDEQERIADKLDAILARVHACRDRLDRVPAILKRFRQSVLAAANSGKLTEEWRSTNPAISDAAKLAQILHATHESVGGHKAGNAAAPTEDVHDLSADLFPPEWALVTLRDLVLPDRPITYGILKPGPELEDGVPYVRVADFPGEKLNLSTIRKTSPKMDDEFKRSRLRPGDVLLSIRGTVGRLIMIPQALDGANITQDSARLSIQPAASRDYVLWYLRSEMAQSRMKSATKGVAVRGINIGDVRALQVPLPSRDEQDEIVRRVESLFAWTDRLEARHAAARAHVERLTPALLAKAFRGELVPQDPADEPASELLKRLGQRPADNSTSPPKRQSSKRSRAIAAQAASSA